MCQGQGHFNYYEVDKMIGGLILTASQYDLVRKLLQLFYFYGCNVTGVRHLVISGFSIQNSYIL